MAKVDTSYCFFFCTETFFLFGHLFENSVRLEFLGNSIVLFSALLAVLSGSRAGSAGNLKAISSTPICM